MSKIDFRVTKWSGGTSPTQGQLQTLLDNEGLRAYRWSNAPGHEYGAHSHPFHKVIFVVQGSITFDLAGGKEQVLLEAGDRLDLPQGIVHSAVVGQQGVVCLEAHVSD
jgi:quercetin dioxygenase-like cupin family protein